VLGPTSLDLRRSGAAPRPIAAGGGSGPNFTVPVGRSFNLDASGSSARRAAASKVTCDTPAARI
jgi:hypothetical protein